MSELGVLAGRAFDAVVFDLDETLIASGKATLRSWLRWADEYGVTREQLAGCQGMPSGQVVEAVLPAHLVAEASARIEELEVGDYADIVPLPGALRAFAELPLDRVAIATSCTAALLEVRFAMSQLPAPAVMVHRGMVVRGKPAPDPFLKATELLGVDPASTLVVEDAPAGIAAARAAGCATLGVLTTTAREDLPADALVPNLDAVSWVGTREGIRLRLR